MQRSMRLVSVGLAFLLAANVLVQIDAGGFDLAALGSGGVGLLAVLAGAASE